MPTTPPNVVLPPNWTTCERGNTWLVNDGGDHIAWFDLPGGQRLEVSVTPGNYPGFYVNVLEPEKSTDASLAKHINGKLVGWVVRKCNIPGVKLDGETIAEAGPELFIQTKSCGEYDRHGPYATEDDRVKAAASAWMVLAPGALHAGGFQDHQPRAGHGVLHDLLQVPVGGAAVVGRILAHRRDGDAVGNIERPQRQRRE